MATAEASKLIKLLAHPGTHATVGGILTPLALDYRMNDDPDAVFGATTIKDLVHGNLDKNRAFNLGFNALLGAQGGGLMKSNPLAGAGIIGLAPAKDLILNSLNAAKNIEGAIKDNADALAEASEIEADNADKRNMLLGALGAGALGLGGIGIYKYLKHKDLKDTAKIKMRLPGKKGDPDSAAEVELPINMPEFSPALTEGLDRAVRLRTRRNIRANSMKRDPETGKLIPYDEWKAKYGGGGGIPEGAPGEEEVIPVGMQEAISKAAGSREVHERLGAITTSVIPSLAGAIVGSQVARGYNFNPWIGGLAGSAIGGTLPALVGTGIAGMSGDRTPEEQAEHDEGIPFLEYLIPGYAAYQQEKRDSIRNTELARLREQVGQRTGQSSYAATGQPMPPSYADSDADDEFSDSDLDDYDKAASAPPPGGGGGGGGGGGKDPSMSRQVDPKMNNVAGGLKRPGDPEKAMESVDRVGQKMDAAQSKPQIQPKRPMSLAEIPQTMSNMRERLHNLNLARYGRFGNE